MRRWIIGLTLAGAGLALAGATSQAQRRPAAVPDPSSIRVKLESYVQGLDNPVAFAVPDDETGRMFVVEKAGTIRIIKDGSLAGQPFLNITERVESAANERGLLGLAFHPNYKDNGLFVVGYTAKTPMGQITYSTFKVTSNPDRADAQSEMKIISWAHNRGNHNGGNVAFGPDGYLYLGTGDGGGAGDPDGNGQKPSTLLGKMLRLDIDGAQPYKVPDDNPFVGNSDYRPEIWAIGLRNPWKYTFDRETGDLYIGDVGQGQWEEIDFQPRASTGGENYGWDVMEGSHCYNATSCDQTGKVLPIAEYSHSDGCSVTGGYVYRGSKFPDMTGLYFYADYCTNTIWAASRDENGRWRSAEVGVQANMGIQSFGEGPDGEIYVLGGNNGRVMHLVQSGPLQATATPTDAPPTPTPTQTAVTTPTGRRVDVKALDFRFEPTQFPAANGEQLNVVLENLGERPHDIVFLLDGGRMEASSRINNGQTTSVSFTAPAETGCYTYYCSVGNHRAMGMEGALLVGNGAVCAPTPTATAGTPATPTAGTPTTPTTPTATTPTATTPTTPSSPTPGVTPTPSGTPFGRQVDIKASEFKFEPNKFAAEASEGLNVVLENIGQAPHDIVFVLDGGALARTPRITGGQTASVSFNAPATSGCYFYYCAVGNHRWRGMTGWLAVGNERPCGGRIYLPRAEQSGIPEPTASSP